MSAKTTEKTSARGGFKSERRRHDALTVIFSILSFIYLIPIFLVAMNWELILLWVFPTFLLDCPNAKTSTLHFLPWLCKTD